MLSPTQATRIFSVWTCSGEIGGQPARIAVRAASTIWIPFSRAGTPGDGRDPGHDPQSPRTGPLRPEAPDPFNGSRAFFRLLRRAGMGSKNNILFEDHVVKGPTLPPPPGDRACRRGPFCTLKAYPCRKQDTLLIGVSAFHPLPGADGPPADPTLCRGLHHGEEGSRGPLEWRHPTTAIRGGSPGEEQTPTPPPPMSRRSTSGFQGNPRPASARSIQSPPRAGRGAGPRRERAAQTIGSLRA